MNRSEVFVLQKEWGAGEVKNVLVDNHLISVILNSG